MVASVSNAGRTPDVRLRSSPSCAPCPVDSPRPKPLQCGLDHRVLRRLWIEGCFPVPVPRRSTTCSPARARSSMLNTELQRDVRTTSSSVPGRTPSLQARDVPSVTPRVFLVCRVPCSAFVRIFFLTIGSVRPSIRVHNQSRGIARIAPCRTAAAGTWRRSPLNLRKTERHPGGSVRPAGGRSIAWLVIRVRS